MKAIITAGDGMVRCTDVQEPALGPYDALVKIRSCLFCNTTDRHIIERSFNFGLTYPCLLGHESIGEVIKTGESVKNFRIGDWVTRPYAVYPNEMLGDLGSGWGGFAELGKVRDAQAMVEDGLLEASTVPGFFKYMQRIPREVPLDEAAMITPLRELYSSASQIPDVAGRRVLIAGAGVAGLLFAKFLHLRGAAEIAIAARRSEACAFALAETPARVAQPLPNFSNQRFDITIDTTGSPDIARSIVTERLAPLSSTYTYAIYPPSDNSDFLGEITRVDPREADAHEPVCELLASGRLKTAHWITRRFSPEDVQAAWQSVTNKEALKTAIIFNS